MSMYNEHQQELLKKVDELQTAEKLSQTKLSERLGISSTALSQIRNNKYPADSQKIFDTLENYFSVKAESQLTYKEIEYAETSISSEIYDIIRICQVKGGLAVACGDAGIGKTKAARKFVADHPTNSVLITVNPCITYIKSLLEVIASRIGATAEKSAEEKPNLHKLPIEPNRERLIQKKASSVMTL